MRYILAHDLGTSGNKATLFTTEGKLVRSVTAPYGTRYFNTNWAEQDPADWWNAVCVSTRALIEVAVCTPMKYRVGRVAGSSLRVALTAPMYRSPRLMRYNPAR